MQSEEVNYKKNFCEKHFDKGTWDLDVLNQVDVLLKDKKDSPFYTSTPNSKSRTQTKVFTSRI